MEVHILKNSYYRIFCLLLLVFTTLEAKAQILAEADCPDAYPICDASQSYYFEVNGSGAIDDAYGNMNLFCQSQTSADQFESSSSWFIFTPKYSGEFGFYILPEVEEDWEFMLFGNEPDCTDLHNTTYHIICNTISPGNSTLAYTGLGSHPIMGGDGTGIDGFAPYINVNAGEQYILFITTFVADGGFNHRATLTFQGGLIETHGADAFEQLPACTLSVDEFNLNKDVQVYPNPVINELKIKSNNTFTKAIIYDLTGKKVIVQDYSIIINTSKLPKGVYILKLLTNDRRTVIRKVVKK